MMRLLAGVVATVLAVVAVAVPVLVALLLMPGLWLPSLIETRLGNRLERTVEVSEPVSLDLLASPPAVELSGLRIANPNWADERWFLRADAVRAEIPWATLARFSAEPSMIALTQPRVHMVRARSGGVTWPRLDGGGGGGSGGGFDLNRLRITDGRLVYRDAEAGTDLAAHVETRQEKLVIEAQGSWRGRDLSASVVGGAPTDLMGRGPADWPLRGELTSGPLHLQAEGTIARPLSLGGVDVALSGQGPTLAEVGALIGARFPQSPPFDLTGRLRSVQGGWNYVEASGTIGDSAIAGGVQVRTGEVPTIVADLTSSHLRVGDALVVAGLARTAGGSGGGSGDGAGAGGPMIPDVPLPAETLGGFALRLHLVADDTVGGPLPLGHLTLHVTLAEGRLVVEPLEATLPDGGSLAGGVMIDVTGGVPRASVRGSWENLRFSVPVAGAEATGAFAGSIDLAGQGESLHAVLGSAQGEAAALVSGGYLSSDILGRVGIGFQDIFGLLLPEGGDQGAALHCAAATATVTDGIADIPGLVVDTETGRMEGRGSLDLGAQTMDLALKVEPADPQLLSISGPIHVSGPWASPNVDVNPGEAILRGLAGLALGVVAGPLAALVPMVDLGGSEESGCGGVLRGAPATSEVP